MQLRTLSSPSRSCLLSCLVMLATDSSWLCLPSASSSLKRDWPTSKGEERWVELSVVELGWKLLCMSGLYVCCLNPVHVHVDTCTCMHIPRVDYNIMCGSHGYRYSVHKLLRKINLANSSGVQLAFSDKFVYRLRSLYMPQHHSPALL